MGTLRLVLRLALRDLRRRPAEAVVLLTAIAVTAATLTLGLAVRDTAGPSWDRTRAVTAGPDAVATSASTAGLRTLARAPGVREAAGPYPVLPAELRFHGVRVAATVQGRAVRAAAVDRPEVTEGSWVRDGGVVVERAYARALGVRPGDRVTLRGRDLEVAGIAITAARPPYPSATPGLVWGTTADLSRLGAPSSYVMPLRLTGSATAFAAAHPGVRPAPDIGAYATAELRLVDGALLTGTWALALLAVACVAVLVGGRLAGQVRRVGLLKAVGATPRLVAAVLLAEHVLLALVAGAAGLVAGQVAAPLLVRPSAGLADLAARPGVTPASAALVLATAVCVAGAATLVPAIRGARISTVRALTGPPRAPRRRSRLVAVSARLPVPLLLGVRLAARRPRRTVLAVASLTITVATVVAAIALHGETANRDARTTGADFVPGAGNPVTEQLGQAVTVLMVALLALAAVNAILIAWTASLDSLRSTALARALGATPWQVTAGLSAAQLFPAACAAVLGVPLGVLVYDAARVAGGARGAPAVPYTWLPALIPGTLAAVALLTAVPIRAAGRRPVARILG